MNKNVNITVSVDMLICFRLRVLYLSTQVRGCTYSCLCSCLCSCTFMHVFMRVRACTFAFACAYARVRVVYTCRRSYSLVSSYA